MTPILVTNPDIFAISWRAQDVETEVGDPLMLLKPVALGEATSTGKGCEHRRTIKLGLAHGLHARPAGRVAAMLKPLAAEVALLAKGRTANARSAVGLMTLGVVHGDALELVSQGADAAAALDMIATFLADDGGESRRRQAFCRRFPLEGHL